MKPKADHSRDDDVAEAERTHAIRIARERAMTPRERLERVHELCRQLSAIRPARDTPRR